MDSKFKCTIEIKSRLADESFWSNNGNWFNFDEFDFSLWGERWSFSFAKRFCHCERSKDYCALHQDFNSLKFHCYNINIRNVFGIKNVYKNCNYYYMCKKNCKLRISIFENKPRSFVSNVFYLKSFEKLLKIFSLKRVRFPSKEFRKYIL